MTMNRKWMMFMLLILGAMIASGCAVSKEGMMSYNEAKEIFQGAEHYSPRRHRHEGCPSDLFRRSFHGLDVDHRLRIAHAASP